MLHWHLLSSCGRWEWSRPCCHFWGKQPNALTVFTYTYSRLNGFIARLPNYHLAHCLCSFYSLKIHLCEHLFLSSTRTISFCLRTPLFSSMASVWMLTKLRNLRPHAAHVKGNLILGVNHLPAFNEGSTCESSSARWTFAETTSN